MKSLIVMPTTRRASLFAQIIAALTLVSIGTLSFAAVEPDQSQVGPPAGDGWQALSPAALPSASIASKGVAVVAPTPAPASTLSTTTTVMKLASVPVPSTPVAVPSLAPSSAQAYNVVPVVVGGTVQGATPAGSLTLVITPQDVNLRNALDRWLQQQGWQLAWKIDDDLPLEFNATFTGDFDALLTQVMRATNHMRTPTRICEHTNNVVRVVARAANCQD
jgi:hypothetical protein